MKIGIDIRAIGKKRTGDEVYFFNLVKNLAKADRRGLTPTINEYFLYADRDPEKNKNLKGEIEKLELESNFRVIFINSPNRFWWNLWTLPDHLRKNPVDVFHTQYIAPFWLPKNIKLVLTIHDISFNFFPEFIKGTDLFFLKTLIPRSIKKADKIITVSQNEKKQIMDYYKVPAEKIDSIYNGVNFERFNGKYSTEEMEKIKSRYGLPASRFMLYVGTTQPRKNISALVAALKVYLGKYPAENAKLVIVGNRKARNFDKKIDEAIEKYNLQKNIIFPGWIEDEDLPVIYKLAACFVFPSLYEGFGIPIVEAMAAGIPVVSSDKSCMPEVGGNAALFANPDSPDVFAEKIHEVLTNKNIRNNLIDKGMIRAQEFSWKKTAEKTLDIYRSLD